MNMQVSRHKIGFCHGWELDSWTYWTKCICLTIDKNYFALACVNCKLQSVN